MGKEIKFELDGKNRKDLAVAIAKVLQKECEYMRMPTCAYKIGESTLGKTGVLTCGSDLPEEKVDELLKVLNEQGFKSETDAGEDDLGVVVTLPRENLSDDVIIKLKVIILYYEKLIKKALKAENLEIEVTDETVTFAWFDNFIEGPSDVTAAAAFVSKLCKMAEKIKRPSRKRVETDNEKYTFRCLLLRLGFVGILYKNDRKCLMRNLTGNAAFRHPKK